MTIKIIGTESLGVRGMCCLITTGTQRILIDPGIALGYHRHGLLPHPVQIETGIKVRQQIVKAMETATDVVFSHFHGDHVPLLRANPYQLSLEKLPAHFRNVRCWSASQDNISPRMLGRAKDLNKLAGTNMNMAEGCSAGILTFSKGVPHGQPGSRLGTVMMTRINMGKKVFVHASDIQLLETTTIDQILNWQPDIVFTAGPPLYLQALNASLRRRAWENGLRLARNTKHLIVDHHLLRSKTGLIWLKNLSQIAGKKVYCAADFINKPQLLLEAERRKLYTIYPVSDARAHG